MSVRPSPLKSPATTPWVSPTPGGRGTAGPKPAGGGEVAEGAPAGGGEVDAAVAVEIAGGQGVVEVVGEELAGGGERACAVAEVEGEFAVVDEGNVGVAIDVEIGGDDWGIRGA